MKQYLNLSLILVICVGLILLSILLFRNGFVKEVEDELEQRLADVSPAALTEAIDRISGNAFAEPVAATPVAFQTPSGYPAAVTSATPRVIGWVYNIVQQSKSTVVGICVGDRDILPPWQQGWEVRTPTGKRSVGSGVIVSPQGYVLTNYHVIETGGDITISLFDAQGGYQDYPAELIAGEKSFDLAILRIIVPNPNQEFNSMPIGNSDKVAAGDKVIAIGNPFGLTQTVTSGIVSARRKKLAIGGVTLKEVLQTDVSINPGNSGGALLNVKGELIGINTAIYSPAESVYTGISFAIPVNKATKLFSNYMDTTKKITPAPAQLNPQQNMAGFNYIAAQPALPNGPKPDILAGRIQPSPGEGIEELAWLGIDLVPENDANTPKSEVEVDEIEGISPMEAGLQAGDVIKAINGMPTPSIYEVKEAIKRVPLKVGQGVVLEIERPRTNQTLYISFRLKKYDIKGR